jgi:hypothetical protein
MEFLAIIYEAGGCLAGLQTSGYGRNASAPAARACNQFPHDGMGDSRMCGLCRRNADSEQGATCENLSVLTYFAECSVGVALLPKKD